MAVYGTERTTQPRSARPAKSTQVNIRVEPNQLATIDAAAESLGRNRTAFMLETALQAAEAVLLDKRLFTVDDGWMSHLPPTRGCGPCCTARHRGKSSPASRGEAATPRAAD